MLEKNILIAESGSTKTDWVLVSQTKKQKFTTKGINPYFDNKQSIETKINKLNIPFREVSKIYFFAPGLMNIEKQTFIQNILASIFVNASVIKAKSDIYASAIAGLGKSEGIAAILGTGASSAYFKNAEIVESVKSLGFILGDEGSGASIGKRFIKAFLENELPHQINLKFTKTYKLSYFDIIQKIYKEEFPNRFLAQFAKFVIENKNFPELQQLLNEEINLFFKKNICKYKNHKTLALTISGSIAYHLKDEITELSKKYNVNLKSVIQYPIDELTDFFIGYSEN